MTVNPARLTAIVDHEFAVFLIGMRVNKPLLVHKWWPVVSAMTGMLKELYAQPNLGFLHAEAWFGRTTILLQYWKSEEHLLSYAKAKDAVHLPAWQRFNKTVGTDGTVGVWHETYKAAPGSYENVYVNMPPFGGVLSSQDIDAVAEYVSQELADPASHQAQTPQGGELFRLYCSGCHSSTGSGGAMPVGRNAPNIRKYPPAEALAAMILGPGNMPALAGNAFDVRQQTSIALYVQVLAPDPPSPGGRGLGYLGPVPEGAVGAVALFLLILVAVWLAWRSRKAVPREP